MTTYRVLSPGLRFCHWIWVTCMLVLFFTGLYIGDPMFIGTQGNEPTFAVTYLFSMESIRSLHFMAAFIFIACILLRLYLFFTYPGNRLFPNFFTRQYWRGLGVMLGYYSFLRSSHPTYIRNPIAGTAYLLVYVLMMMQIVTGLAMYAMIRPESLLAILLAPINSWLGNEYTTHVVHHTINWIFSIFVLIHVYLVIYNDIVEKSGELSSIMSGRKYFKEQAIDEIATRLEEKTFK